MPTPRRCPSTTRCSTTSCVRTSSSTCPTRPRSSPSSAASRRAGYIEVPDAASAKILDFPSHIWWCRLDGETLVLTAKSGRSFDPEVATYIERVGARAPTRQAARLRVRPPRHLACVARQGAGPGRGHARSGLPRRGAHGRVTSPRRRGPRRPRADGRDDDPPPGPPIPRSISTTSSSPSTAAATTRFCADGCTRSLSA